MFIFVTKLQNLRNIAVKRICCIGCVKKPFLKGDRIGL